ncbi:MAG: hypothetical protein ACRYF0_02545 [Janthinobacterium lividum]
MSKVFLAILIGALLLAPNQPVAAQQLQQPSQVLKPEESVDSTFRANFLSFQERIDNQQPLSSNEAGFAYVVDLLSGQDFFPPTDWSGVPQLTDKGLVAAQKWYRASKRRIEWTKLQRGLVLMTAPLTDEAADELLALKIK